MKKSSVTILGAGSFGTAMAHILAQNGNNVVLWARDGEVVSDITTHHQNSKYFPGFSLKGFAAEADIQAALKKAHTVLFAIPSQFLRAQLERCQQWLPAQAHLINLAKGIENGTLKMPSQIFSDVLGEAILKRYATISGPTFAKELYLGLPTAAVVASPDLMVAQKIQHDLSAKTFRLYAADDLMGVELGGALKNVMALQVGIADGLGFGQSARAGLITRCLHEMIALGNALGANPLTFAGLSGIGDLILTCTGDLSRNRQVGLRLGRGEKIDIIIKSMNHVAEGVATAKSVYELMTRHGLDMPNCEHVYRILYEGMTPKEAVNRLLGRALRTEFG